MPRKTPVNIHDELVRHCMTAPLAEVAQLLATATSIVKVRSQAFPGADAKPARARAQRPPVIGNPPPPPAGTFTGFQPAAGPQGVAAAVQAPKPPKPPKPPVRPPSADDAKDLAAARERANVATGVTTTRRRSGPSKAPRPPVADAPPIADPIPAALPPQTAGEE